MFTTSLSAALLAGLFASGSLAGSPEWSESYGKAMAQIGEKRKPVAVFLAAGELSTLTNGKGLGTDALKSLKSNYIAVRIDTTTEDGKKMAEAFGLTEGVVLSDRSGQQMALKHEGQLSPEQLSEYLTKYASVETAQTTDHRSAAVPVQYYQPVQYQQNRPVMNAIQNVGGTIQNVGGMMFSPFSSGSS